MFRFKISAAVLAAASLTLAACGSDTSQDAAADLAGEPIKISVIAAGEGPIYQPEIFNAAYAAAESINAAGGVEDPAGGEARPIEIVECEASTASNANAAVECARDAINAGVIASASKYVSSDPAVEAFADAGIPVIGTVTQTGQDFLNPMSFPLAGGAPILSAGSGAALQEAGAKTIALVTADLPSGRSLPDFMKPVLADPDDLVKSVFLPVDNSADLTAFFSQVVNSKADGVAILTSTDLTTKTVIGLRQAGYRGMIGAISASVSKKSLAQMGEAGAGLIVASDYEAASSDTPEIKTFNAELDSWDKAKDETTARSAFAINSWVTIHYIADQLAGLDTIDADSLAASMGGATVELGLAPAFQFDGPVNFLKLPRIPRSTIQVQQAVDGDLVALTPGAFIDLNELVK